MNYPILKVRLPGFNLFKIFSVYAAVMFFNAAVSFAVFSWLTHRLSPADFGIINLYSSYGILLVPFISIGTQFILNVDYFQMKQTEYSAHFKNGLFIPLFMCFFFTLVSLLFVSLLKEALQVNTFFVLVVPFSCLLIVYNDILIAQIRNRSKHSLYARYSIFKTFTECAFTIILVAMFSMTWQGRLGGSLISLVLCGGIFYYLISRWQLNQGKVNQTQIVAIAIAGLPFIPERLAIFFMAYSDRFFINHFQGTYDVGLYGAGAQVGTIINLVSMALGYALQPVIFKRLAAAPIDFLALRKTLLSYMGIALIITLGFIVAIPFIFSFFIGALFRESSVYAINLSIGGFFWAVYNAFLAVLLYMKKNKVIMYIALTGMISSIVLNFINVQHFGAIGATYTSIIVYMLMALLVLFNVNRYLGLKKIFLSAHV